MLTPPSGVLRSLRVPPKTNNTPKDMTVCVFLLLFIVGARSAVSGSLCRRSPLVSGLHRSPQSWQPPLESVNCTRRQLSDPRHWGSAVQGAPARVTSEERASPPRRSDLPSSAALRHFTPRRATFRRRPRRGGRTCAGFREALEGLDSC